MCQIKTGLVSNVLTIPLILSPKISKCKLTQDMKDLDLNTFHGLRKRLENLLALDTILEFSYDLAVNFSNFFRSINFLAFLNVRRFLLSFQPGGLTCDNFDLTWDAWYLFLVTRPDVWGPDLRLHWERSRKPTARACLRQCACLTACLSQPDHGLTTTVASFHRSSSFGLALTLFFALRTCFLYVMSVSNLIFDLCLCFLIK